MAQQAFRSAAQELDIPKTKILTPMEVAAEQLGLQLSRSQLKTQQLQQKQLQDATARTETATKSTDAVRQLLATKPDASVNELLQAGGPEAIPVIKETLAQRKQEIDDAQERAKNHQAILSELGNTAFGLKQLPPEQRPAAHQAAVQRMLQSGMIDETMAQQALQGGDSDEELDSVIATTPALTKQLEQARQKLNDEAERNLRHSQQLEADARTESLKNPKPAKVSLQTKTIEDPENPGKPLQANFNPETGETTHPTTGKVIATPREFIKAPVDPTIALNAALDRQDYQTAKKVVTAADSDYQAALDRVKTMDRNKAEALKGNQQAMLSLLTNHIGMTLGAQKGARITQAILDEAAASTPWLQKIQSKFDSRGYLSGVTLSPEQMGFMVDLAHERAGDLLDHKQRVETEYHDALSVGTRKPAAKKNDPLGIR